MAKLTKRADDYAQWYVELVQRAELADYAPVRGCMVIRPHGYAIWENMQRALDGMFKATGHQNAYFPLFIPESFIKKEAEHVEGFAPHCAVVTHGGGKELEEPLYVRPTSETIIWAMYKQWIQSHRDLPLLINQWANVVRWEMRPRLFLRTIEFLWQEGHTAHATEAEAEEETLRILEIYRTFAEDYMAVPVVPGQKTEAEKFAGAVRTYCIEAMTQDKRAIQAGTSHMLGQNFAKAFDVTYQDAAGQLQHVWATSWGVSTRLVGALVMAHSDDQGLVLPPKLAPIHVVIVPIYKTDDERAAVLEFAASLRQALPKELVVRLDDREQYKPGWKFNEWELKGVPLRIEVGPRDVQQGQATFARRDTGEKRPVPRDAVVAEAPATLAAIQKGLFDKALAFRQANTHEVRTYAEFKERLESEGGFFVADWGGTTEQELQIQEETKATIRCIPRQGGEPQGPCFLTGGRANVRVILAKAY
ncbi:MAG TPA: proline--tRNA ligase [Planctomycetota bacterium]|nr:proline--tRNA ligase [Planctomycetota bacterium]HRR78732.1 proline--tRNA ligase [Planctomycetota bacterium]HRT95684.1 proline--tRNA ligase [Planctomycetota bacterium]